MEPCAIEPASCAGRLQPEEPGAVSHVVGRSRGQGCRHCLGGRARSPRIAVAVVVLAGSVAEVSVGQVVVRDVEGASAADRPGSSGSAALPPASTPVSGSSDRVRRSRSGRGRSRCRSSSTACSVRTRTAGSPPRWGAPPRRGTGPATLQGRQSLPRRRRGWLSRLRSDGQSFNWALAGEPSPAAQAYCSHRTTAPFRCQDVSSRRKRSSSPGPLAVRRGIHQIDAGSGGR
jgi:hypothetical protein